MKNASFLILAFGFCLAHAADETMIQLKQGQGVQVVTNNCATCHSLDYIQMNSPFLDRKGWEAEVNKMINVYHAPIDKNDVTAITDYLVRYYGASPPVAAGSGSQ